MNDSEEPDCSPENNTALAIIEPSTGIPVPAMIAGAGERASLRYIDFFTAHIRNPNTRAAYGVAVRSFFAWLEMQGVAELGAIRTHHVSTYIETLTRSPLAFVKNAKPSIQDADDPRTLRSYSAPTVKQHLAAIRRLFDWLIVGQVIAQNPAAPVRGPSPCRKKRQDAGAPR
jgi:site-specific recombinase XerD